MVKTLKRFIMVLSVVVLVISFGIPLMVFSSKAYAEDIPAVGEPFQGGKVGYKLNSSDPGWSDGIRAVIVTTEDQSAGIAWITGGATLTTANGNTSMAIGKGQANTNFMIAQTGYTGGAAKVCKDYSVTVDGTTYSDWFLPSANEIGKILPLRNTIGGFVATGYWSSAETNSSEAWDYMISYGALFHSSKSGQRGVRAVRYYKVDTTINIAVIPGVTPPVTGATTVTAITATAQYTGTTGAVTWSPSVTGGKFAASTAYTATITLTPITGFTLTGVAENFFTVSGATTDTNPASSGVITAVFPATAAADQAAPTGLTGVAPTSALNDGKITGTTTAMEYKLASGDTYTACLETETTGLIAGDYLVRLAAQTGYNAGATSAVTVPAYAAADSGSGGSDQSGSGGSDQSNSGGSGSSPAPRALTLDEWIVLNHSLDQLVNQYGTTSKGFIKMLYDNCMLRRPDESGLNSWDEQLTSSALGANFVVENFIFSDEIGAKVAAMTNDEYISFLYSSLFARIPDNTGYNDWLNYMNSGFSKEEILKAFLNSEEWISICSLFNVNP